MTQRTIPTLVLVALLGGCGFQLRGYYDAADLTALGPVQITGLAAYDPMYRTLSQVLGDSGVEISDAAATPAKLRVSEYRKDRRVYAVDSRNKVIEYELQETLVFALRSATGANDIPAQRLQAVRLVRNPEDEVLGRGREEELLRNDMRAQLARHVVDRIAAVFK